MGLLDKFNSYEVESEFTISDEDKEYLENLQSEYDTNLELYRMVYEICVSYNKPKINRYGNDTGSKEDFEIPTKVNTVQKNFPRNIYRYFENKYSVKLDDRSDSYEEKYNSYYNLKPDAVREKLKRQKYEDILKDIESQLGGVTFGDLALTQLKSEMKKLCYNEYKNTFNISVRGSKVKYESLYISKDWYYTTYKIHDEKFCKIFPKILSHFCYGKILKMAELRRFDAWRPEITEEEFKTGISFVENPKVVSMKIYKNGRVDINFKTPQDARDFATNYCGLIL